MEQASSGKLAAAKFYELSDPFVEDLIALYSVIRDDVSDMIQRAVNEGWTVEKLENEINHLLTGEDMKAPHDNHFNG